MRADIPDDWDEAGPPAVPPSFDFDVDPVVIWDDEEDKVADSTDLGPEAVTDPDLDNAVIEFVDVFNARDFDGLVELFAPGAEAFFLGESTSDGIASALADMVFRYPNLVVTRGDIGLSPVVPAWLLDPDTDGYRFAGLFTFELFDKADGLIGRLEYVEGDPDEDAVFEIPDDSERAEWDDWSTQDEI